MAGIVDGLQLDVTFIDYDHDGDLDLYVTQLLQTRPDPQYWGFSGPAILAAPIFVRDVAQQR